MAESALAVPGAAKIRVSMPAVRRGAAPLCPDSRASCRRPAALLVLLALGPAGARAARAAEPPSSFVLTFSNPGARSLAFGGAFAPLADDATAAYANPAGLVQLLRPEVSAELRIYGALENDSSGKATVSSADGLSHFSVVYPLQRFSFAVYGHQLARIDVKLANQKQSGAANPVSQRAAAGERLSSLDIWRIGVAAAYRLRENLSLGLGVSYFHGTVGLVPSGDVTAAGRSVTSTDWAFNAGALWSPSEPVRLGAFYRQGPKLSLVAPEAASCQGQDCTAGTARPLRLPDTFGAGAALRTFRGALTVAFEWDRVRYSSLVAGLSDVARGTDRLSLSDANEFHVGAEYAFLRVDPVLAARLGAWLDPDHRLCGAAADSPYQCPVGARSDEIHVTAGFGVTFRRIQLDVGIDASRSQVTASISAILSF